MWIFHKCLKKPQPNNNDYIKKKKVRPIFYSVLYFILKWDKNTTEKDITNYYTYRHVWENPEEHTSKLNWTIYERIIPYSEVKFIPEIQNNLTSENLLL
jgi:hypothetical protein